MPPVPLAVRVVEVISDLGPAADSRYRYGSGCIVRGRTVLTAAHVVADAVSVVVRDPGKREYSAAVDPRFVGDVDGPGPDLALLEIDDSAFNDDLPKIGLAAVDRNSVSGEPVERCHAVGYPWFTETRSRTAVRDTVDAIGVVPVLSKLAEGLLSVQVRASPRELPPQEASLAQSAWSGMSGAPVVAAEYLLGVVTEHAPREGPSTITAVPLTALQADPVHGRWGSGVADPAAWWSRLGVGGIEDLHLLPVLPPPRPEPAYRATLREFGRALHHRMPQLLGRDRELAKIEAFTTGGLVYRWLVGGAFAGKTALLYEAVTVGLPDEVDVVCYFMSRRASDATGDRFLAAVVPQLAYLCDADPPVPDVDQYRALWEMAAVRANQTGRHLLLVVDGLDEDLLSPGSPSVASLLPTLVGPHAHVLVASRPWPTLPDDVPDSHSLRLTDPTVLDSFEGGRQLAELARHEIRDLMRGDDADLAVDVLGLLTAAAGPLSLRDLVVLRLCGPGAPAAADIRHVRRLVEDRAARSLEPIGPAGHERYQFAHSSLFEFAQTVPDLCDREYRQRIHRWAQRWRDADWPIPADGEEGTPQYLLDTYPSTLIHDSQHLAQLASDAGWVEAAIASAGFDRVLADLRRAAAANPASPAVAAVLVAVILQAHNLRPPQPVDQPGFVLRQLWMQSSELAEHGLAEDIRRRLQSRAAPRLVPLWTTRRVSRALFAELGRHDDDVTTVAVLADGRVVTGGRDGRVLLWDLAHPGDPVELGSHDVAVGTVAVLADGRIVSCGRDEHGRRMLVWDPAHPGADPAELSHDDSANEVAVMAGGRVVTGGLDGRVLLWDLAHPGDPVELGKVGVMVGAVAVLADGRVVTDGGHGRVLVWDPAYPGTEPANLGSHHDAVSAVAVLADGRVVTGGLDGRVLMWDPAHPGTELAELDRHYVWVNAVAVLADGRVVIGWQDGQVLVWDPAHPATGAAYLGRHDAAVSAVAVLADGRVVTGGWDRRVLVWDPAHSGTGAAHLDRHDDTIGAVAVLADGRVVTGGWDRRVLVWDPAHPGAGPAELGHDSAWIGAVAVLADGRVVTGGWDRLLVWDPAHPGTDPAELGSGDRVLAMAVLAGSRVVTGGWDGRVLVWDPAHPGADPHQLGQAMGTSHAVNAVAVLADGRVVTGGDDFQVLVWDPAHPGADPDELGRHDRPVHAVAVLADGRVVTGGVDGQVLVWDPAHPGADPEKLGRHDGPVHAVAVLADGRVVTGGEDRRVLVRDPAGASSQVLQLSCSVHRLCATSFGPSTPNLIIAHEGGGFSLWSFT